MIKKLSCLLLCTVIFLSSCAFDKKKQTQQPLSADSTSAQSIAQLTNPPLIQRSVAPITQAEQHKIQHTKKLDFEVENQTGKTIFITCFSYIKRRAFTRWRWDKSDVYQLEPGQSAVVAIDDIDDARDRKNVFGYLALFNTHKAADEAVYELLSDNVQIDLDQLEKLRGKKVVIEVEKYGAKGEFYEYDFIKKKKEGCQTPPQIESLDFPIENKTGKPVYVVCFTYEKKAKGEWIGALGGKDDMALWHYQKEPILKLMPGQMEMMHIAKIVKGRDQIYAQGYLAVFNENEEKLAQAATYERLSSKRRLTLGRLFQLEGKKIVLDIERYGIANNFIDYRIKPIHHIDFTKIKGRKKDFLKETKSHAEIKQRDTIV